MIRMEKRVGAAGNVEYWKKLLNKSMNLLILEDYWGITFVYQFVRPLD